MNKGRVEWWRSNSLFWWLIYCFRCQYKYQTFSGCREVLLCKWKSWNQHIFLKCSIMIKDYLNKYAYFLFSKELMLIVALIPSGLFLCKNTHFSSSFFSSSSVWWISGPSRNVWLSWKHPTSYQERGKTSRARWGTLWSTVLKSF